MSESDRTLILKRLNEDDHFYKYVDCLMKMYHDFNEARQDICEYLTDECIIMGGMLYFSLYREAQHLNLIRTEELNDHQLYIFKKFWEYKTVDIDIQGHINNQVYEDENGEITFVHDSKHVQKNWLKFMDNLYHDNYECFLFVHKILKNKPLLSHSLKTFEHGFGLNFKVTDNADILEYRPQITVRVGDEEDHLFEALLLANVDLPDTNVYNLSTVKRPFVGENIISAATQQLLWRLWPAVDTSKSAEEIFSQMKNVFKTDPLVLTKFNQGYYRSYVVYYILEQVYKHNVKYLLKIMLPTNGMLAKKIFFLKGKFITKIIPKSILNEILPMYSELKKLPPNKPATPLQTLNFLKTSLEMWTVLNENIKNAT